MGCCFTSYSVFEYHYNEYSHYDSSINTNIYNKTKKIPQVGDIVHDKEMKSSGNLVLVKGKNIDGYSFKVTENHKFMCPVCEESFKLKDINFHLEICKEIKVYCQKCSDPFDSKKALREHSKICPNRVVKCEKCSKNYIHSHQNQHDQECHHEKCAYCSKYIHQRNMQNHVNNKCSNRIVQCIHCYKNIKSYQKKEHERICKQRQKYVLTPEEEEEHPNTQAHVCIDKDDNIPQAQVIVS